VRPSFWPLSCAGRCKTAGMTHHNTNKAELLLDTEGVDHRFVIELDSNAAERLYHSLEITFKGSQEIPDDPTA
jgi:hypothetical protein